MKIQINRRQKKIIEDIFFENVQFISSKNEEKFNIIELDFSTYSLIQTENSYLKLIQHFRSLLSQQNITISSIMDTSSFEYTTLFGRIEDNSTLVKKIESSLSLLRESDKKTPKSSQSMLSAFIDLLISGSSDSGFVYELLSSGLYKAYLLTDVYLSAEKDNTIILLISCVEKNILVSIKKEIPLPYIGEQFLVKEILFSSNIHLETDKLLKAYKTSLKGFEFKAFKQGKLFVDTNGTKYINDNSHHLKIKGNGLNQKSTLVSFGNKSILKDIPFVSSAYFFNLDSLEFSFKETSEMELYKFDQYRELLHIIPQKYKNILNSLINNKLKFPFRDEPDSTTILFIGDSGVGKSTSCLMSAEKNKKPLLSVSSYKLGSNVKELEKNLHLYLGLAFRWDCFLLIDDADVLISKRDGNLEHDSMIVAFSKLIGLFNGVAFITATCENNNIDSLFRSRCDVVLPLNIPDDNATYSLWKISSDEFDLNVDDKELRRISNKLSGLNGNDIKHLSLLVAKYISSQNLTRATYDEYKICFDFKGFT